MAKVGIVGREKEIAQLRKIEHSGKQEFVAIYGRRRVGKTFLVNKLLGEKLCFSFSGVYKEPKKKQLHNFAMELMSRSQQKTKTPKSWTEAFWMLEQYLESIRSKGSRLILFFDELPWIETPKSGFIRALDYFWNHYASTHSEIMLVVCGSATSWMVDNLINDKGGLHNRITSEVYLRPFTLHEMELYLKKSGFKWTRRMVAQVYMIIGGIPYYLDMLDKDLTLPANIDNLMFNPGARLKGEYKRLYASLFGRKETYTKIITLLSKHGNGLTRSDIKDQLKIASGSSLTTALTDLVNCNFIEYRRRPNTRSRKSSGIYMLVDFFTLFHFHFMQKNDDMKDYWTKSSNTPEVTSWQGLAFERLCMAHADQIRAALHIDTIKTSTFTWRSKPAGTTKKTTPGAQIDMVIERADGMTHVCEIKFNKGLYVINKTEASKIEKRVNVYRAETNTRNGILVTLITPDGLASNAHSHIVDNCITLNALFDTIT